MDEKNPFLFCLEKDCRESVRREKKRERERERGREGEAFARINERVAQDAVSSVLPYPGDTHEAAHGAF